MAISFVAKTEGLTGVGMTMPAHIAGDLLLLFTYRDGSISLGDDPVDGSGAGTWVEDAGLGEAGSNSNASRVQYLICSTNSHTAIDGTLISRWIALCYRGTHTTDPIGGTSHAGGASTDIPYAALSMDVTDGTSWVVGFAGHRSIDVALETPPTGMTNRSTDVTGGAHEGAAHDTNGGVSAWTLQTVTGGGTSSGYRVAVLEIKADAGGGGISRPTGLYHNRFHNRAA